LLIGKRSQDSGNSPHH